MSFHQILFPVDFSDRSVAAARYVGAMAALWRAKIALVHAVEDPLKWYGSPNPIKVVEGDIPRALRESEECLERFADTHLAKQDVTIAVEIAVPLELIEKRAHAVEADLIMMPTHGRGRFRAALLGSVTAKVLHDLTIPVWTDTHQEVSEYHWPIKKVACAIDLGPESPNVLRFAADFANRCGAEMFIAHGLPLAEMTLGPYRKIEPPAYMEDFARTAIERLQREAGTSVEVCIEKDPIASALRNAALRHRADLVVTGRGAISHPMGRLAAHVYSIIREVPCPVLSL